MADDRERRKHPRVEHVPGQLEMFAVPACSSITEGRTPEELADLIVRED